MATTTTATTPRPTRWDLWSEGETAPCETITRANLREYLADGTMTRADVRRLYQEGETVLSGTGGAMPMYLLCEQDREPVRWNYKEESAS